MTSKLWTSISKSGLQASKHLATFGYLQGRHSKLDQYTSDCLSGICSYPVLSSLRDSGQRFRVLLRSYISHHQTSEQGRWWSHGSQPRSSHGNHITWSERWTGSAAGDWRLDWQQIVSHRVECSQDDDHRYRVFPDILERPWFCQFIQTSWGKYEHQQNTDGNDNNYQFSFVFFQTLKLLVDGMTSQNIRILRINCFPTVLVLVEGLGIMNLLHWSIYIKYRCCDLLNINNLMLNGKHSCFRKNL